MMYKSQRIGVMLLLIIILHHQFLPCKANGISFKNSASAQTSPITHTNTTINICADNILHNHNSDRLNISFGGLVKSFRTEIRSISCSFQDIAYDSNTFSAELIEDNGLLLLQNKTRDKETRSDYFYPQEYCIHHVMGFGEQVALRSLSFNVCLPMCDEYRPCIRKCCKHSEVLTTTRIDTITDGYPDFHYVYECNKTTSRELNYEAELHHNIHTPLNDQERKDLLPHYIVEEPFCQAERIFQFSVNESSGDEDEHVELLHFKWLRNGSSVHQGTSSEIILEDGFCAHTLDEERPNSHLGVVTCLEPGMPEMDSGGYCLIRRVMSRLNIVMYSVAAVFFFATGAVYILLWHEQNIHGKTVACHVFSSFVMSILFCSVHLVDVYGGSETKNTFGCVFLGVASHFFSLSSCCWLTMVNVDLWWKFRVLTPTTRKAGELQQFIFYNLFAWGAPLLIILTGLILDSKYMGYPVDKTPKRPRYSEKFCYVARESQWEYVHYFLSSLFIANLILFVSTVISIYLYKRETFKNLRLGQRSNQDEMFIIFTKLTTVMGFTWGLDIFSKILQEEYELKCNELALTVVMILDALNILRAIPIFLIFTYKRKIFAQLWFKHTWLQSFLVCIHLPSCFEALNRERALSHTSTMQTNVAQNQNINKIAKVEKARSTTYEDVAL